MAETALEAHPPEVDDEVDPTDLDRIFFRKVRLSKEQREEVITDLDQLYRDAIESRGDLDQLLAHWNDMAEGIAKPKDFPWPECSNLFVPLPEIHLNNIHSGSRQTMLKGDQLWYVKSTGLKASPDSASKAERYLNYRSMVDLPLVDRFSQGQWCALRDGTVVFQVQWLTRKEEVPEVQDYASPIEFTEDFSSPEAAGMTAQQYDRVISKIERQGRASLVITRDVVTFRGPSITVVELADFLMAPITAERTEFARFVGNRFELSESDLHDGAKQHDWDGVDEVIKRQEDGKTDLNTTLKDEIEGIYRKRLPRGGMHLLIDGIHRYDLDGDGIAERYLAVYHPLSKTLLAYLHYPYLHGKDCFVPMRMKKRPRRFLGRGICQMLDDISSEVNTQHNQRVDSRSISTVPSFKALNAAKGQIGYDPSRPETRFRPGGILWLDRMGDVDQFKITQTDLGETLQEESTLFSLADQLTGSSQLRSGKETKADPRAPAAKVNLLINQSNVRLDDYFEEMAGSVEDNEGMNAVGCQILDLYDQFHDPDLAEIPDLDGNQRPTLDEQGQPQGPIRVQRTDLRTRGRLKVQLAKTSSALNPDAMWLKFMQLYSLLIQNPLVGGRMPGLLALTRKMLALAREENPDQYLPNEQELQQMMLMQQLASQQPPAPGRGPGQARNRGGQVRPSVPSAGGSTRPTG